MKKPIVFVLLLGAIFLAYLARGPERPVDPDTMSVGYMDPGQCMSGAAYNRRAKMVVENTDWSKMVGSATFSAGTRSMIGGMTVFDEMRRLGTHACPDLDPLYQQYVSARGLTPPATREIPTPIAHRERVQLKTGGNIRREPSAKAPIIRAGRKGDVFQQFGLADGWVQVGVDNPEGWISEGLLTRLSH